MQTVSTQRTAVSGTALGQVRPSVARCSRSAVVRAVADSADTRRSLLAGVATGLAGLALARSAAAVTPVDLFDDRAVREKGFDIIYEARDLELPQNVRDGLTQARSSVDETLKRIKESENRIDTSLAGYINKSYWTLAREELRGQLGTLRFDLNVLAEKLDKPARKKAQALKQDFLKKADELDYAIRKKDPSKAEAAYASVKASLDSAIASLG